MEESEREPSQTQDEDVQFEPMSMSMSCERAEHGASMLRSSAGAHGR